MRLQAGDHLLEFSLCAAVRRQYSALKRRVQFIPDDIHLALKVVRIGGDCDNGVFVRNYDTKLAPSAVAAVGVVRAAPELKTVALRPINADLRMAFLVVWNLFARSLSNPVLRNQLLA